MGFVDAYAKLITDKFYIERNITLYLTYECASKVQSFCHQEDEI